MYSASEGGANPAYSSLWQRETFPSLGGHILAPGASDLSSLGNCSSTSFARTKPVVTCKTGMHMGPAEGP